MAEYGIIDKEEAWTYDEITYLKDVAVAFVGDKLTREDLSYKLNSLCSKIDTDKTSMALFFMPRASFNILSFIYQDKCGITLNIGDLLSLKRALISLNEREKNFISSHMLGKLSVLYDYIDKGGEVYPVPIQSDTIRIINV